MSVKKKKPKYKNKGAYCLMLYSTKSGKDKEWIWNSRDGTVPLIVMSKNGKLMQCVKMVQKLPVYVPKEGRRYFAEITKKRAMFLAEYFLNKKWVRRNTREAYRGLNRSEALFMLNSNYMAGGVTILQKGKSRIKYLSPAYRRV